MSKNLLKALQNKEYEMALTLLATDEIDLFYEDVHEIDDSSLEEREDKYSAMHYAACHGYNKIISLLYQKEPGSLFDQTRLAKTALCMAAQHRHLSTVSLLLDLAEDFEKNYNNRTVEKLEKGKDGILKKIKVITKHEKLHLMKDFHDWTVLHWAVFNKDVNMVSFLLERHKELAKDIPLHMSVLSDDRKSLTITRLLIQAGAKINTIYDASRHDQYPPYPYDSIDEFCMEDPIQSKFNTYKASPLHVAAEKGAVLQARLLIKSGASLSKKDDNDRTAAEVAKSEGHTRIKTLLRFAFDDDNASDTDSEDEIDYVYQNTFSNKDNGRKDRKTITLEGILPDGNAIQFEEEDISPNGNCGFIGLGTSRKELTEQLLLASNDSAVRESVWLEMAESLLTGEIILKGSQKYINNYFQKDDEKSKVEFKLFLNSEKTFIDYMNILADEEVKLFLGYGSALAYARIVGINLYIWQKDIGQKLVLSNHEENGGDQTIHLLHTAGFTHFNLLVVNRRQEQELKEAFGALEVGDDFETPKKGDKEGKKMTPMFVHWRGNHFYPNYFDRKQRRNAREIHLLQQRGKLARTGLYSSATHEISGVSLTLPDLQSSKVGIKSVSVELTKRENKLLNAHKIVSNKITELQETGPVKPCLQHQGNHSSREDDYESRYIEFIQRYVNSYKTLMADISSAPEKDLNDKRMKGKLEKWTILKGLGFSKLPLVSTTEEARWALEYAFALVNWDKSATHQPRDGDGIKVLAPIYQADGHARFPYLGVVYATLHSQQELTDNTSTRVIDLFVEDLIDTKCASPGGHITGGYIRARERVFISGVDSQHVVLSAIIRVPNFHSDYRPFYQEKYGLSEKEYNYFKTKLKEHGVILKNGKMRNELNFHRIEQEIIEFVIDYEKNKLNNIIIEHLKKQKHQLSYYGIKRNQVQEAMPAISEIVKERDNTVKNT